MAMSIAALLTGGSMSLFSFLSHKERLLFHPETSLMSNPKQLGIAYENVNIFFTPNDCDITVLRGWWIPSQTGQDKHVILYCHGSTGNMSDHLDFVRFVSIYLPNCAIFMFDYLGYGDSGGDIRPSLKGCHSSTYQAFKWLINEKHVLRSNIIVWGEELGGVFATWLVHSLQIYDIGGLVLQGCPQSIYDFISQQLKPYYLTWPIALTFDKHVDVVKHVKAFSNEHIPVIVIHACNDPVIPFDHGKNIAKHANSKLVPLAGKKSLLFTNANIILDALKQVLY